MPPSVCVCVCTGPSRSSHSSEGGGEVARGDGRHLHQHPTREGTPGSVCLVRVS